MQKAAAPGNSLPVKPRVPKRKLPAETEILKQSRRAAAAQKKNPLVRKAAQKTPLMRKQRAALKEQRPGRTIPKS